MPCSTPVVFLIFRRPDLTAQVFEAIRQAQPTKLLVVADGPRNEEEVILCQKAREITEQVDWDCEVLRNYAEINLGCRKRVSSGLDWAFEQVEEAIILEDDCLPHLSFFRFCEELLKYYRNDNRIMVISGNNFQDGIQRSYYSYYFSKYGHCWGWATWRRAWQYWDFDPIKWLEFRDSGLINYVCEIPEEAKYRIKIYDDLFLDGNIDSWAYAWTFACWSQGALSIIPKVNLVKNIGFGQDATHTKRMNKYSFLPTHDIGDICHSPFVVRNVEADSYTFYNYYGGNKMKSNNNLIRRLKLTINKRKSSFMKYFKSI